MPLFSSPGLPYSVGITMAFCGHHCDLLWTPCDFSWASLCPAVGITVTFSGQSLWPLVGITESFCPLLNSGLCTNILSNHSCFDNLILDIVKWQGLHVLHGSKITAVNLWSWYCPCYSLSVLEHLKKLWHCLWPQQAWREEADDLYSQVSMGGSRRGPPGCLG